MLKARKSDEMASRGRRRNMRIIYYNLMKNASNSVKIKRKRVFGYYFKMLIEGVYLILLFLLLLLLLSILDLMTKDRIAYIELAHAIILIAWVKMRIPVNTLSILSE